MGFILDSSGSLRYQYDKEKDFLKQVASSFVIGEDHARMSVITFSYYVEHSIKLNDFDSEESFFKAVDGIPLMGSVTRIDRALQLAEKEMFSFKNGGRPNVPKLLFLLTDGSQTKGGDSIDPAIVSKEIIKRGIKVITVGIGNNVDINELSQISGSNDSTFTAQSFNELTSSAFVRSLTQGSCKQGMYLKQIWLISLFVLYVACCIYLAFSVFLKKNFIN